MSPWDGGNVTKFTRENNAHMLVPYQKGQGKEWKWVWKWKKGERF